MMNFRAGVPIIRLAFSSVPPGRHPFHPQPDTPCLANLQRRFATFPAWPDGQPDRQGGHAMAGCNAAWGSKSKTIPLPDGCRQKAAEGRRTARTLSREPASDGWREAPGNASSHRALWPSITLLMYA